MARLTIGETTFQVPEGILLSQALYGKSALEMPCAGQGRCGKCRVRVQGELTPPGEEEKKHLSRKELESGILLACHTRILRDCRVESRKDSASQIQGSGQERPVEGTPLFSRYGAAVDVGTTTLAARLYGKEGMLAQASALNRQNRMGADVISRIEKSLAGYAGELADSIRQDISALLKEMAAEAGILPEEIDAVVITGNTAMLYFLTESCPEPFSHAPFQADRLFGETVSGEDLELPCPKARVYLPPCISAFVGADITTALLSSGLCSGEDTKLLVDIGTNGEMALWHKGELFCCSTAAGPAFEGAGLSMGMGGREGAVDHVSLSQQEPGGMKAHVIGDGEPIGICGSGVIDAVACLLELERLDETGYMEEEREEILPPVGLTQKDVRMIQLAKSAICAGLETLMETRQLSPEQIGELCIAGGFGSYLNVENAGRIGLIPEKLVPRVHVVGNAALAGACRLLLSREEMEICRDIARQAHTVELSSNPLFMEKYTEGMFF